MRAPYLSAAVIASASFSRPSSTLLLANFTRVRRRWCSARVRPLRERRRACLFARGGGSSVSPPRAVGISISYSTAVDEACYFPCVRRLVPPPTLWPSGVYTATFSSLSSPRSRDLRWPVRRGGCRPTTVVVRVCLWSYLERVWWSTTSDQRNQVWGKVLDVSRTDEVSSYVLFLYFGYCTTIPMRSISKFDISTIFVKKRRNL